MKRHEELLEEMQYTKDQAEIKKAMGKFESDKDSKDLNTIVVWAWIIIFLIVAMQI